MFKMGASNSLAVLTAGLFLLDVKHSERETCGNNLQFHSRRYKIKNMLHFSANVYFQNNFLEEQKKKKQLGKSDLCFFFQGVLKLVRNLVLCLGNTRPLNSPLLTHPLAPQHKQHCPNMRQAFFQPAPPHFSVTIKYVTPQVR